MKTLSRNKALELFEAATKEKSGRWIKHSQNVAKAAEQIASNHPTLDKETAYVYGLLHDYGRSKEQTRIKHVLSGYEALTRLGYDDVARICVTHSFPYKNDIGDVFHCEKFKQNEYDFIWKYIQSIEYTDYDKLIQLCDHLAFESRYCLLEERMVDIAMRYGVSPLTIENWRCLFEIKAHFEQILDNSVYNIINIIPPPPS
ncbi:MAG: HD domain-containing protein [Holosporaceae bacterium]|jgi:putative nucleotidyltransferase with HDIG domain|nr:HD domain-containing protein [Holosporaceae bacterium]